MAMASVLVFMLGTVIGSFLNVIVYRLGTGEGVIRGRSRCFSCGKTLVWYELIPLASFLLQKGRCRYCGSRISWQYPIAELVTGSVFMLISWNIVQNFQFSIFNFQSISNDSIFKLLYFFIIFSILIAISVYDIRHKIIPNQLVYPFIILSFFFPIIHNSSFIIQDMLPYLLSGFFAWVFFASLWWVSGGRWMGFGDAKLALGIGFLLGPLSTLVAVVLSFWIGTLIAVPVTLVHGGGLKTQIPFGPFLAAGAFAAWVFSDAIPVFSHALLF